jgi:peptidoglycan/xylan/chitin deacetylase (PgdA/CDA1 family)
MPSQSEELRLVHQTWPKHPAEFRLDRIATLYLFSPLARFSAVSRSKVPILMYHSIGDEDESAIGPYFRIATSPSVFAAQMECLHREGYATCSLAESIHLRESLGECAPKIVVITFDDGYQNFYEEAFPVLKRFGFTATVFLPTAYIGESTLRFNGRPCLTWAEVRELHRHGIRFGSHTVTHPQLSALNQTELESEIGNSKLTIEDKIGCAVESFAYPYAFPRTNGEFRLRLRASLDRAGYRNGVCTTVGRSGAGSDPLLMERLPVNDADDRALFQAKLRGTYDWFAKAQFLAKAVKGAHLALFAQRPG